MSVFILFPVETSTTKEKITSSTQIPRFAAFLEKKKQEQNKPVTPGNNKQYTQYFILLFKCEHYSQTCHNGHLFIMVTCS